MATSDAGVWVRDVLARDKLAWRQHVFPVPADMAESQPPQVRPRRSPMDGGGLSVQFTAKMEHGVSLHALMSEQKCPVPSYPVLHAPHVRPDVEFSAGGGISVHPSENGLQGNPTHASMLTHVLATPSYCSF